MADKKAANALEREDVQIIAQSLITGSPIPEDLPEPVDTTIEGNDSVFLTFDDGTEWGIELIASPV